MIYVASLGPLACHLHVWRPQSRDETWLGALLPLPALLSNQQGRAILLETSPHEVDELLLHRPTRVLGCRHGHTGQLLRRVLSLTGHLPSLWTVFCAWARAQPPSSEEALVP